jgi:hypothetical protein
VKIIKPTPITDARFISSTIPEPYNPGSPTLEIVWNASGFYAEGDRRIRTETHRIYRCKKTHTGITIPPELDEEHWDDVAPTNRWAMFDNVINTQSTDLNSITVSIAPGIINGLALIELVGEEVTVTMREGVGSPSGPVVYTRTVDLDISDVYDWYTYFFEPFTQRKSVVLLDLPPYLNNEVTVTITGPQTVAIGGLIVGVVYTFGSTQYNATAGIRDYSRKVTDEETGVVSLEQRRFSKRLKAKLKVPAGAVNALQDILINLRATPTVWVGDDTGEYEALTVFGFYRDFELDVAYPTFSFYTLDIEGMT